MASFKKLAIGTGLVLTGLTLFASKKYKETKHVISNLKFTLDKISNVKINFSKISFDAQLVVNNPTDINFGATLSSAVSIKKIRVYNLEGKYLGYSNTNIFNVYLPSHTQTVIDTITITLSSTAALKEFTQYLSNYLQKDFSRLYFEIDIVAFDNTLTLTSK